MPERRLAAELKRFNEKHRWELVDKNFTEAFCGLADGNLPWPMFVHGNVGCGKTIALRLVENSVPGSCFMPFQTLLMEARAVARGTSDYQSETSFWKEMRTAPTIVIIDDIGSRTPTDFQYETLYNVIEAREDRPLIISSNLSPAEISKLYDNRIASRLCAGTILHMDGGDRRSE